MKCVVQLRGGSYRGERRGKCGGESVVESVVEGVVKDVGIPFYNFSWISFPSPLPIP